MQLLIFVFWVLDIILFLVLIYLSITLGPYFFYLLLLTLLPLPLLTILASFVWENLFTDIDGLLIIGLLVSFLSENIYLVLAFGVFAVILTIIVAIVNSSELYWVPYTAL
jgi:hypothetical protein